MNRRFSTEGLARASARHPWRVIGAWVAGLLAAGLSIAALMGGALTMDDDFTGNPESKRADALIEQSFSAGQADLHADEAVVVHSAAHTVDDAAFGRHMTRLQRELGALHGVRMVSSPAKDESLISDDRHTAVLLLDAVDAEPVIEVVSRADGPGGFQTLVTGQDVVDADFEETAAKDLQTGELYGVALALVILLVVFGALVASVVPIAVAISSIVVALGLTAIVGQLFTLSFFTVEMLVMMGLAVGIDYSLFVLSRYREQRAAGQEQVDAVATAGATASRAVLFSGIAVVLGLMGMFLVPQTIFRSLATGAMLVVLTSVFATLTLLPAVLGVLGDRVDALRLPLGRRRGRGLWPRVADAVMRRPRLSLTAGVAVLVALAVPYTGINTGSSGVSTLPDSFQSKRAFERLEEAFGPQRTEVAEIVVSGEVESRAVRAATGRLQARLRSDDRFGAMSATRNERGDVGLISVAVAGDPMGERALSAVRDLREEYIPDAFAGVPAQALVAGTTAGELDFYDIADRYQPIVLSFVLGLSFLLLLLAFRSIVVPATAIAMNLLSVGAAYGLLVLVFQHGVGADLLGFRQVDTVEAWLPLFLFTVLFGLSMDYHVFMLSRIRERYEQTGDTSAAVSFGIRSTARIITGAALIMVAVFGGFASGELVMFQQMGFGLGVAVLLDATLVRSVLVPATMKLLGPWNWYLPRPLRRLPTLRAEPATE
jgi:putative drug exporter of the RND superfamily